MQATQLHASAVSINNKAVLILGQSGSGKSAFSLQLMALGGHLIGDDQVFLNMQNDKMVISSHPNAMGRIEVRGVGVFEALAANHVEIQCAVNLDREPSERLPKKQQFQIGLTNIEQYDLKGVSHGAAFIYLLLTNNLKQAF